MNKKNVLIATALAVLVLSLVGNGCLGYLLYSATSRIDALEQDKQVLAEKMETVESEINILTQENTALQAKYELMATQYSDLVIKYKALGVDVFTGGSEPLAPPTDSEIKPDLSSNEDKLDEILGTGDSKPQTPPPSSKPSGGRVIELPPDYEQTDPVVEGKAGTITTDGGNVFDR